jgi:hypothetical protein
MNELRDHFGYAEIIGYISSKMLVLVIDGIRVEWFERTKQYTVRKYVIPDLEYETLFVFGSSCCVEKLVDAVKAAIAVKALEDA